MDNCEKYSENIAYHISGEDYTYGDLKIEILKISRLLAENSDEGKVVGVLFSDDIHSYSALFACWYAGKAFVPLNVLNPVDRNFDIIEQAGIKTVLYSDTAVNLDHFASLKLNLLNIGMANHVLAKDQLIFPADDQLAYLLFTSGSTGIPKGVPIHFEALNSFLQYFIRDYDITEKDKFLQIYDISFDGSIPSYLAPLCFGASAYTVSPLEIKYLSAYKLIRNHELTVIKMTPSILAYFKPFFKDMLLEKVRYSIFGGESLSDNLAKEWSKCVPAARIQNVYGPTEATVFCLRYEWLSDENILSNKGIVSLGKPTGENEFLIIDNDGHIVEDGEKGELCIKGPQLFHGYWNNKQNKESEKFLFIEKDGQRLKYYKTGDLAFKDHDGNYMFCGRIDSQIKIQGYRVELNEIEYHSRQFSKLSNLAAIGIENPLGINEIHLYTENGKGMESDLLSYLQSRLPVYMVPSKIIDMPELPKSVSGKIDRAELKKLSQK